MWVSPSETEGAPCLKRTKYMILRGGVIPVENAAVSKKADHREEDGRRENYLSGPNVPAGIRGYTVYAGDNMNYLASDRFRQLGVVELTALQGSDWDLGFAREVQLHFFPEWDRWLRGEGEIPVLLGEWEKMVSNGLKTANTEPLMITGEEMLESARLFRVYANTSIERNRQAILSLRTTNTGGFYVGWSEKSRLYAAQLGISLEDETTLKPQTSADTTGILEELQKDREIRLAELEEQKAINRALIQKLLGDTAVVEPIVEAVVDKATAPKQLSEEEIQKMMEDSVSFGTISGDTSEDQETTTDAPQCSANTKKGNRCSNLAQEGSEFCPLHQ